MQSALYVSISAQVALEKRLETIANNLANMKTAAFRADAVKFETAMSHAASQPVAFRQPRRQLHLAAAWRRDAYGKQSRRRRCRRYVDRDISGPSGTVYTRDGRMQISSNGELQTVTGYPVLDSGGYGDPRRSRCRTADDRPQRNHHRRERIRSVYLACSRFPPTPSWSVLPIPGVIPDRAATAVVDFVNAGFQQGYVEGSNVDPMSEMTQLMTASRAFQSVSSLIEDSESTMQNAIRSLGEPSKGIVAGNRHETR